MPRETLEKLGWGALKLGLCGASLVAVACCIVIIGGESGVEDSRADILAFGPLAETNTERFEDSLQGLGHGEPRIYSFNGNEVGFSTRTTRRKPRRLVEEYQRAFVRNGINRQMYVGLPGTEQFEERFDDPEAEIQRRREALMSGQIVPLEIGDTYAVMGGALVEGEPQTRDELEATLRERQPEQLDELFAGFRTIEIFRAPEANSTSVTASWSRGEFDIKRHMPEQHPRAEGVAPDRVVPACMGCVRQMRFAGRANAQPDDVQIFRSEQKPSEIARFYDRAMRNRGWRRTETDRTLGRLLDRTRSGETERYFRQYERDDRGVTINIRRSSVFDETTVTTYRRRN